MRVSMDKNVENENKTNLWVSMEKKWRKLKIRLLYESFYGQKWRKRKIRLIYESFYGHKWRKRKIRLLYESFYGQKWRKRKKDWFMNFYGGK
jgi:hypothetical protein